MVILYNKKEYKSIETCPFSVSRRKELKKVKPRKRNQKIKLNKQGKGVQQQLTKANRQYLIKLGLKVLPPHRHTTQ